MLGAFAAANSSSANADPQSLPGESKAAFQRMKILFSSHAFAPSIGGIETVSLILAEQFVRRGHEVIVVTQTTSTSPDHDSFSIVRGPSFQKLIGLVRWCDVVFHNNISLQSALPLLFVHRPWVVAHQTWIRRTNGRLSWQDLLKRALLSFARCIAISDAVAVDSGAPALIIPNPYRDDIFRLMPEVPRNKDFIFVGRLVSDKGADLLLRALTILKAEKVTPTLTIVGDGPEREALQALAKASGIQEQISWTGAVASKDLAPLLNQHQVLVVPSRWNEPFGVVALEGVACGCVVIGSAGGGLKDVIGPCGDTFENGDAQELAVKLAQVMTDEDLKQSYRSAREEHLRKYSQAHVADAYLRVLEDAAHSRPRFGTQAAID